MTDEFLNNTFCHVHKEEMGKLDLQEIAYIKEDIPIFLTG